MKIPPMFLILFLLFRPTIYAQAVLWYDLDICTHSDTVKITSDTIIIFDHGSGHFIYETCLSCATLLDTVRLRQQGMGDGYV